MAHKINSLKELLSEELGDLYSAEKQLVNAIPKMAEAVQSLELKTALENHLEQTKNHVSRLEEVFKTLGEKPYNMTCKAMKGIVDEGSDVVHKTERGPARDAAVIGAAQRVEHYEIAGYGTAQSHAALLGYTRVRELLNETLGEEKEANTHLNDIAEGSINMQAKQSI